MSLAIQPFFLCAWAHVPLCLWNGGLGVPHNTVCYTTSRSPDKTSSPCIVKLSGENYGVLNHQVPKWNNTLYTRYDWVTDFRCMNLLELDTYTVCDGFITCC